MGKVLTQQSCGKTPKYRLVKYSCLLFNAKHLSHSQS